ncbi:putative U3 small nucleolar RNA interacting protein [Giardia muris]|uniref:Putative U3 small nucleolar RNA interacting protein n=1 Tax=Giardia muris TaxID=5742 RepID=A0A4Z1SYA3_GIAMU|nr:putative U3 small nucleolar RNA interacting protein [Giardia muris]|eukprot:TNJ30722.1 putative U3 small nucleolar RNA interacting protein [Giardia muris]
MSAGALRREQAQSLLADLAASGQNVSETLLAQVRAMSVGSSRKILTNYTPQDPRRVCLRGPHGMGMNCIAVGDGRVYLGSADGTVSGWEFTPLALEKETDKPRPLTLIFGAKGRRKLRIGNKRPTFLQEAAGIKHVRHPFADISGGSRLRGPDQDGHYGPVMALAATEDGAYVISAGADCLVNVREGHGGTSLFSFIMDSEVGALAVQGHQLFVATGISLKVFSLDDRCEMYTLHGPESSITGSALLLPDTIVTCGLDRSVRIFDTVRQTQTGYASTTTLDAVCWPVDDLFVSGGVPGLIVHSREKKHPILTIHPYDCLKPVVDIPFEPSRDACRKAVTALCAIPHTGVFVSGAHNLISLWVLKDTVPVKQADYFVRGFVNGLILTVLADRLYILAATSKYPLRGRWDNDPHGYNGLIIVDLACPVPTEQRASRFTRFSGSGL